jgi:hypothetical protein
MTKDEIIELQGHVYEARRMYWKLLLGGKFPNDDYAKAIFTCYFALGKVSDMTDKYLLQLPLEEPKPDQAPLITQEHMAAVAMELLTKGATPITDELWPPEPPVGKTTLFVNSDSPGTRLARRRADK